MGKVIFTVAISVEKKKHLGYRFTMKSSTKTDLCGGAELLNGR